MVERLEVGILDQFLEAAAACCGLQNVNLTALGLSLAAFPSRGVSDGPTNGLGWVPGLLA